MQVFKFSQVLLQVFKFSQVYHCECLINRKVLHDSLCVRLYNAQLWNRKKYCSLCIQVVLLLYLNRNTDSMQELQQKLLIEDQRGGRIEGGGGLTYVCCSRG